MSIVTTFPFDNTANYTKVNTEVSGGAGRLALVNKPSQVFNQAFASDTGFTYNNLKTEFVAGVIQQKDRTPTNSILAALYNANADFAWRKDAGSLVATLVGAPSFVGGAMVCTGNQGARYASYVTTANETLKVKYTPNYTGAPPSNINIMASQNLSNNNDRFILTHSPSGNTLRGTLYTNVGGVKLNITSLGGAWSPTAGQEYELEFVVDSSTGIVYIFIDGVLHNSTNTGGPFARGGVSNIIDVGASTFAYNRAEASFNDFIMFSDAQHTANYTPGYTADPSIYGTDTIDLPNFSYSLQGTIQTLDTLATTEANAPRYTFEGQYWNGSAWVASDGSYAQAIDKATAITNLPSLDMTGQTVVSSQIVWDNSNLRMSVDDLTISYTGQEYPLEGSILTNPAFVARDFSAFIATEVKPANTTVLYAIEVGGVCMYWTGTVWAVSDCTSAQANTLADIQANIDTLLNSNSSCKILIVLTTTDQDLATPEIDIISVTYDFGALEPAPPSQCQVFGFLKDSENLPIAGAIVTAVPNRTDDEYKEAADRIIAKTISKTTDANGYFSMNLIISSDFEVGAAQAMRYVLSIAITGQPLPIFKNGTLNANQILFEVPNLASVNITDQIGAI